MNTQRRTAGSDTEADRDSYSTIRPLTGVMARFRTCLFSLTSKLRSVIASKSAEDNGTESPYKTHSVNLRRIGFVALDLLLAAGFILSLISLYGMSNTKDGRVTVLLNANGKSAQYLVWPKTVGEFLREAQIVLNSEDIVSYPLDAMLDDGMSIEVDRAFPVAVASEDKVTVVSLGGGTVGDALAKANILYDADDELSHKPFAELEPGQRISYASVEIEYATSYRPLYSQEIIVKDSTMYEGKSVIQQEGRDGTKQITQRITIKDGVEISRETVDQAVIAEAVDEVIRVGTRIRYQTSYLGEWRRYKAPPTEDMIAEVMHVECTAYTHTGERTAKGTWPDLGTIAVNPKVIPYYSKIYVPGYGYGTALDTGGFRHAENGMKNLVDLFFNTEGECRRWGRKRNFKIYILKNSVVVPRNP
ncbi:MAG: G5 domain-containing protein [Candidatus Gastranaerophilaceae bacterium]|jgi:3D (Asp-Asp-Asp) domain-containing protein|nr:G5 domain-containing protein [Christensenellales bacterium]